MKHAALLLALSGACGGAVATPAPPIAQAHSPEPQQPPSDARPSIHGTLVFPPTAKAGTAVFLLAKHRDANGKAWGQPLVVTKLVYNGGDLPFVLDESMAMVAGTDFAGDILVIARYDTDGDAVTKQPGDFIGEAPAHVPETGVVVRVTTPLR